MRKARDVHSPVVTVTVVLGLHRFGVCTASSSAAEKGTHMAGTWQGTGLSSSLCRAGTAWDGGP